MDIVTALAADLRDIAADLDHAAYTPGTLAMLKRDLRLAVRSSLGYSLALVHEDSPTVTVHVIDEPLDLADVPGSLQLGLGELGPYAGGTVTFYASRSGAFTDLAASIAGLLLSVPGQLVLDAALPDGRITPGVAGLTDFSEVNYAVGMLVGHGLTLDGARAELRRRAGLGNIGLIAAAQLILYG